MKTSDHGITFITHEESCIDHVYKDQIGKDTVCVGHLVGPKEVFASRVPLATCEALLATDLARFEAAVNAMGVDFTQWEFDALVSLAFNIGVGHFENSEVVKLILAGDFGGYSPDYDETKHAYSEEFTGAAGAFWQWRRGAGKILPVLQGRRHREAILFLTGNYG